MKFLNVLIGAFGLLAAQGVSAASCLTDVNQMEAQIAKYGSISTHGCPFHQDGWGVVTITEPEQTKDKSCAATCTYKSGHGSNGMYCYWSMGNWGDTLNCI